MFASVSIVYSALERVVSAAALTRTGVGFRCGGALGYLGAMLARLRSMLVRLGR